jgi:branched-chain amino acid transport system permease protein
VQRSLTEREKALMVVTGAVVAIFVTYLLVGNRKLFAHTILDGITLAAEYFMVASGFTLVFGLMRQVNLAHGSLYLLGAYVGWSAADATNSWYLGVAAGFLSMAVAGVLLQLVIFRRMEGQDLRQTLVTIGLSIVLADLMKWQWGAEIYQLTSPAWLVGFTELPFVRGIRSCASGPGHRDRDGSGSGCSSTARPWA